MISIDLSNKVALVTGGSGELGRVISRRLAEAGAAVAVHYNSARDKAQAVVDQITESGGRAVAVGGSVCERDAVFAMRDAVADQLGSPDIIVNNAVSQIHPWQTVLEEDIEDYEDQFRTTVLQNVLMAKAFVPAMIEKKWGRVIATNTECTMQCHPTQSAYVSGKRGADGLLRCLAREVGEHNITVNQVAPGWTISDKYRGGGESQPGYEANVPLRRRGEDIDIANGVVFLASDMARFITGCYLPVCGGNVMPTI